MIDRLRRLPQDLPVRQFARFVVAGVLNTATTYLLFLALLRVLDYRAAYTLTYAAGILLAYVLNSRLVFDLKYTLRMGLAVLASYGLQYCYGLMVLSLLVGVMAIKASVAMAVVIVTAFPMQFLILRMVARTIPQKSR